MLTTDPIARLAVSLALAVVAVAPVRSPEPGWPQWRGPARDGISAERVPPTAWQEGGPRRLWRSEGIGSGYSSPIIAGGRIFVTGDFGAEVRLTALDMTGKLLWQTPNGKAWRGSFPGARSACAYARGRVFHLNAHGRLACLDAATGKERWAVEVIERFGGRNIEWGLSECVLVDWPRIIVTAGGSRASVAALDATTGRTVWAAPPVALDEPEHKGPDAPSYASPVLADIGGMRVLIGCTERSVWVVGAADGRMLWSRPMPTRYGVIAMTPVLAGDGFLVAAPDTDRGAFFRIEREGAGLRIVEAWRTSLDACQGGALYAAGRIHAARYRRRGWVSLDPRTGAQREETADLAMGAAIWAGGRLICVAQDGEVALVKPTDKGFAFEGRFRPEPATKGDLWAHPVVLDGRLYLRVADTLQCFDLRGRGTARAGQRAGGR
jgi:outer membrane protein assembly factor BamB